ncbi:MAG: hypothetical protein ACK5V0_08255 [Alphaproteobacteria bacterium]
MFSFLKNRRAELDASNEIGRRLHSQIFAAMQEDEASTSERLQTPFATGFIYMFVRTSYLEFGIDGEPATDRRLKHILEGVIPGRLHNIFQRQLAAVQLAKSLERHDVVAEFEAGLQCGIYDGMHSDLNNGHGPQNLYKHLTRKKVVYRDLKDSP